MGARKAPPATTMMTGTTMTGAIPWARGSPLRPGPGAARGPGLRAGGRDPAMRLRELATTIRSKNAGVDLITFDILFPSEEA